MLKKLVFTIAIMSSVIAASAQGLPTEEWAFEESGETVTTVLKPYTVTIGPRIGMNYAIAGDPKDMSVGMAGSVGFQAGLAANVRFGRPAGRPWGTERFGVQLEVLYAMTNLKSDVKNISMSGFQIPVLFQWYFVPNFAVEVGPTFSGAFGGPKEFEVGNGMYELNNLKAFDVLPTIGVNCKLKNGFTAGIRYGFGLSDLAGNFQTKVSTLQINLGWLFPVVK